MTDQAPPEPTSPPESRLTALYKARGLEIPAALSDWADKIDGFCWEYEEATGGAQIVEVEQDGAVYLFDLASEQERVVCAYGLSAPAAAPRDTSRMAGFPDVNVGWARAGRDGDDDADRGHLLAHTAGGGLDINLFPQARRLNRGWSKEGKLFREMERYVADHPGTFFYHRLLYTKDGWIPDELEYGVLRDDRDWWIERFKNAGDGVKEDPGGA